MSNFRVGALRRALLASLLVPLAAGALFVAQEAGLHLPERRWVGSVLLAVSGVPTTLFLLTAATGRPLGKLEREWDILAGWQRTISSAVALACGLTTGAALVLIILSLVELDAKADEEPAADVPATQESTS